MKSSAVALAFDRRAERAEKLARESPGPARVPLDFAAGLYRAQGAVATAIEAGHHQRPLSGRPQQDLEAFGASLSDVLRFAAASGPPALRAAAEARLGAEPTAHLGTFWQDQASGRDDYLARALLRPYVEVLAALNLPPKPRAGTDRCPFCGGPPWIGWRREAAQGDGAQRFLGCALCGGGWSLGRILCPACTEAAPEKLPSFQSDRHPNVRIETCATCHTYVKSIDLTTDARAIPEVDDLVSLSMDLWATEEGYTRLEPGLAGI